MLIYSDWFVFIIIVTIVIFFFFDEEPFIDPTDWNIIHILLLLISILVIVWDSVVKAKFGQFVYKDQVLVFITFSYWFFLENYFRIIIIVSCWHFLTPLEIDLVDLVEIYQNFLSWYTIFLVPTIINFILIYLLFIYTNFCISFGNFKLSLLLLNGGLLILLLNLLILLWDLLLNGLTFLTCFESDDLTYYNDSRSGINYRSIFMINDTFDWHASSANIYILRFEDIFFFFLQLFNIVAIYSLVYIYIFIILDFYGTYALNNFALKNASYTFSSILYRWLDHSLWSFVYSFIAICFIGCRVYFRISYDFNF